MWGEWWECKAASGASTLALLACHAALVYGRKGPAWRVWVLLAAPLGLVMVVMVVVAALASGSGCALVLDCFDCFLLDLRLLLPPV